MTKPNILTPANALSKLWEAAAESLTLEQLEWFDGLDEIVQWEANNIANSMGTMAFLMLNVDESAKPSSKDIIDMLTSYSHQVETIAKLFEIVSDAQYRIYHHDDIEARRKAR